MTMASTTATVKYDTLLKPVQDSLLKDWGLSLSLFLDDFMAHIEDTERMNFSEAAMIIQNSTNFYCKRVDVVHKAIQEFLMEVQTSDADEGEAHAASKNSDGKKRKKNVRSLETDDLTLLDYVASDHSIDAKLTSIVFKGQLKQIVLPTSMKALRKAGTAVAIRQANGAILGYKDEFRIFGRTWEDGTVNDDFNFERGTAINPIGDGGDNPPDESFGDLMEDDPVNNYDDAGDEPSLGVPPEDVADPTASQVPGFSGVLPSVTIPVATDRCAPRPKPRSRNFDWEPIPLDSKFPIKPLKIGKSVNVPEVCVDEDILKELEKMKMKARKRKKGKDPENPPETVKIMWIDQAIRVGITELTALHILKEKQRRKQLPSIRRRQDESIGQLDDPAEEDFEAFQDDHDLMSAAPVNKFDAMIHEEDRHEYVDEALKAIEKFKEARRENASRQTDIAKRVAKWHEDIMPKLAEAEARSHLDVHEYGTRILDKFPDDDPDFRLTFHEIVKDEPGNEICRYLLAMLMLANTYNVEIIRRDVPLFNNGSVYCDYVELRLITKVRHHEEMDEALRLTSGDCGT